MFPKTVDGSDASPPYSTDWEVEVELAVLSDGLERGYRLSSTAVGTTGGCSGKALKFLQRW